MTKPGIKTGLKKAVLKRDRVCQKCHSDECLHIHHVLRRSEKGYNKPESCVVLCENCHREWHILEHSNCSLTQWLTTPSLKCFISWYQALSHCNELSELSGEQVFNLLSLSFHHVRLDYEAKAEGKEPS